MEWIGSNEKIVEFLKKYKFILLLILLGILLMLIPEKKEDIVIKENKEESHNIYSLEVSLEDILSKVEGAGKVSVLLTEYAGEERIYQLDESVSQRADSTERKQETIILTDSERDEAGMIRRIISPIYQGAIVVCQGADKATVCLAIVEAVTKVTGLNSNQISVLKMK